MGEGELLNRFSLKEKVDRELKNFKEKFEEPHEDFRKRLLNYVSHICEYNSLEMTVMFKEYNWKHVVEAGLFDEERFKMFQIKNNTATLQ